MKKYITFTILPFFLMLTLSACALFGHGEPCGGIPSVEETPFDFNTQEEFESALTSSESERYIEIREKLKQYQYSKKFEQMILLLETGKMDLLRFQLDGETVPSWRITLFPTEKYDLPCIWYSYENNSYLNYTYISLFENADILPEDSFLDILMRISPAADTPENYSKSEYLYFYESEIVLADGTATKAIISKARNEGETRVIVRFRYDDVLVHYCVAEESLTENFWQRLSFVFEPVTSEGTATTAPDTNS